MNQPLSRLFTGENIPVVTRNDSHAMYLKLDSRNKIFSFRYTAPSEQYFYFDFIGDFIQDKEVSFLIENLCSGVLSELMQKNPTYDNFLLDKSLLQMKRALAVLNGDINASNINPDKIVCRCSRVDLLEFSNEFLKSRGVKKNLIKSTNISLKCGSCKNEVDYFFNELTKHTDYIQGLGHEEVLELLRESLLNFKEYTALDFNDVGIKLVSFKKPIIELEVNLKGASLVREDFEKPLSNYLCAQLNMLIELRLTTL